MNPLAEQLQLAQFVQRFRAPAVAGDDVFAFSSENAGVRIGDRLICADRVTGALRWSWSGDARPFDLLSAAAIGEETVAVGRSSGELLRFRRVDGRLLDRDGAVGGFPTPVSLGGALAVVDSAGRLVRFAPGGGSREALALPHRSSLLVESAGCVLSWSRDGSVLPLFGPAGALPGRCGPVAGARAAVVSGDALLVATAEAGLECRPLAGGDPRWSVDVPRGVRFLATDGRTVWAVTPDGVVAGQDARSGEGLWGRRLGPVAGVAASPGRLYLDAAGEILALGGRSGGTEAAWRLSGSSWGLISVHAGQLFATRGDEPDVRLHSIPVVAGSPAWSVRTGEFGLT